MGNKAEFSSSIWAPVEMKRTVVNLDANGDQLFAFARRRSGDTHEYPCGPETCPSYETETERGSS